MLSTSAILIALLLGQASGFSWHPTFAHQRRTSPVDSSLIKCQASKPQVDEQDWRAFRAKLVIQEQENQEEKHGVMDKNEDMWAYESGSVVEQGSVILNRPPSKPYKFFGFGLGRQYLHKSVMLVLEHDTSSSTTGVILNRPTDLVLDDSMFQAQIWYGGPEHGIHTQDPKFYCLHNLQSDAAKEVSRDIISGICFTPIAEARNLVERGEALATDFWVFCGFTEIETDMLASELEENLWHSVATDAKTLRNGLRILNAGAGMDPRDAGLSTWTMLMKMIGRPPEEEEHFDDLMLREWATKYLVNFDDLMLREWETKNLLFDEGAPRFFRQDNTDEDVSFSDVVVTPGSIVRGSSAPRSPFLLENQEYHKSLMLVIQDDENCSVGVLLNHPTDKYVDLRMLNAGSFSEDEFVYSVPLRYGGPLDLIGAEEAPLFFLHNSLTLREASIGEPVGSSSSIWRCTTDDAAEAIAKRLATPQDFMVINGFCVWEKEPESGGSRGGIKEEIVGHGNFELSSPAHADQIWDMLITQEHLSRETINNNVETSKAAWTVAGGSVAKREDHPCVFKSNVKVSSLSDDAFKVWVAAFFLDDPTIRP